jgi:predicted DCC family thiol-disulfide oxidoreductase YuxK
MAWILFFDGDCAFCSASVQRVAHFDRRAQIDFARLQGGLAREKGFTHYADSAGGTMVLFHEASGETLTHSAALIQLTRIFGGFWLIFTVFRLIPKSLRDRSYSIIARNRYCFMGKVETCKLQDREILRRLRD